MSELRWDEIDRRAVDTARVLAADAVEKVGNGHPGTAMSLAPAAYLLYQRVMRHDPADVHWPGRDRFILSAGHSSLTQYVQLYLGGFGLELDDLKALRTWGSLTPGHPEFGHTDGVEITTGPLGQGLASSVGFAYAARYERGLFDPDAAPGTSPFDHFIYVIASDGDLQEGVTSEASSLAGHQELGNLVVIYDSNQISIEDDTNVAFTEDVAKRYEAYGWHVQTVDWKKTGEYVEDVAELYAAIEAAKGETSKPSIIVLKTIIGWPSPGKQNTGKIHGSALGADELAATKKVLGWDPDTTFVVPEDVLEHTRSLGERGATAHAEWQESFDAWAAANPERKALFDRLQARELPEDIADALPVFEAGKEVSTRAASGTVINALAAELPELWGGSADLAESNLTTIKDAKSFIPSEWSTHEWSGDPLRPRAALRHPRARDGRDRQRHRAARSDPRVRRHVPDLQRLHAPVGAPRLADEHPVASTCGRTTPSPSARTARRTSRSSSSRRCAPSRTSRWCARPTRTRPPSCGSSCSAATRGPAGLALTRQNIPVFARGEGAASGDEFAVGRATRPRAPTCWPRRRAARPT